MTVREITLQDVIGTITFTGELLADSRDDGEALDRAGNPRSRWTDIAIYRVHGSEEYAYVVHTVGRSTLYHRSDNRCGRRGNPDGALTTVADIATDITRYETLEPCPACQPEELEHLNDDVVVRAEEDRPKVRLCTRSEEVIAALKTREDNLSILAQTQLAKAAKKDPGITLVTARRL